MLKIRSHPSIWTVALTVILIIIGASVWLFRQPLVREKAPQSSPPTWSPPRFVSVETKPAVTVQMPHTEVEPAPVVQQKLTKQQLHEPLLAVLAEWKRINSSSQGRPRLQWEMEVAKFRQNNADLLAQIKQAYGREPEFKHPSEMNPLTPDFPFDNAPVKTPPDYAQKRKQLDEFKASRDSLMQELKTASSTEQSLLKWEKENAARIQAHREKALQLNQLDFEEMRLLPEIHF